MSWRLLAFVLLMALATYGAYQFDKRIVEPAVSRAGARVLGISVDQYRAERAAAWGRVKDRLLRR